MPALADLYTRTPQGRAAAFNPLADLPVPLKTLLKAVDGKTATSALATTHVNLGDVPRLLALLQNNGLIADKKAAFANLGFAPGGGTAFVDSLRPLVESSQSSFDPASQSQFSEAEPTVWSNTSPGELPAAPPKPDSLLDRMAQQVADTMATFVLTHLPQKAFTELQAIESIFTPDQLRAALPKYEILVQPLGSVGKDHFLEINQLTTKLFSM
jgi:hypothetical protein